MKSINKIKLSSIIAILAILLCIVAAVALFANNAFAEESDNDDSINLSFNYDTDKLGLEVTEYNIATKESKIYVLSYPYCIHVEGYDTYTIQRSQGSSDFRIFCASSLKTNLIFTLHIRERKLESSFVEWEGLPEPNVPFSGDRNITLKTEPYSGKYSFEATPMDPLEGASNILPVNSPVTYKSLDGTYEKTEYTNSNGLVNFSDLLVNQALGSLDWSTEDGRIGHFQIVATAYDFNTKHATYLGAYHWPNRKIDGDEGVSSFVYNQSLYFLPVSDDNFITSWTDSFQQINVFDLMSVGIVSLSDIQNIQGAFSLMGNCVIGDNGDIQVSYSDENGFIQFYGTLSSSINEGRDFDYWEVNGEQYNIGESFEVTGDMLELSLHTKASQPGPQPGPEPTPTPTPAEEANTAQTGDNTIPAVVLISVLVTAGAVVLSAARKRAILK